MSIELAPKKYSTSQERLRQFFNAEHSNQDLSPEEVKRILTCTPEEAINQAINEYAQQQSEELWDLFLVNSSSLIENYNRKLLESHRNRKLVINNSNAQFMKDIVNIMKSKGASTTYKPTVYIESVGAQVVFRFNVPVSFDNDIDIFTELINKCSTYIGRDKAGALVIKCEFFNIGLYI